MGLCVGDDFGFDCVGIGRSDGGDERHRRDQLRSDLLAKVAGLMEGVAEGQPDEPLIRQVAQLCRDAGADPELIPGWVEEGRRRRADAGRASFGTPRRIRPGQHPPGRGG